MPIHSGLSNLGNTDWNFNSFDIDPDISNDIQQTLTRLIGYNANYDKWLTVPVDAQGRILVSTSQVQGNVPSISTVALLIGVETLLLSVNNGRRAYTVMNTGAVQIQVYFVAASGSSIPLASGGVYTDDLTLGTVYGKSLSANTSVTVIEY